MLYNKFKTPIILTVCILFIIAVILIIVTILKNNNLEKELANKIYPIATTSDKTICYTPVDLTHYSSNTLKEGISVSEAIAFFDNSILIGDSVTSGFNLFHDNNLGNLKVYGIVSYGIANALKPITNDSLHPLYEGNQIQIWNLVKKLKAEKVFLMFGLNDLGIFSVKDSLINYKTLINAIKEHNPNVKIYVLSTTPVTKSYKGLLDINNIREFNNYLRYNSEILGITYIDIASYLMDKDGYLKYEYSSDKQFHLEAEIYDICAQVLRSFASYNLY